MAGHWIWRLNRTNSDGKAAPLWSAKPAECACRKKRRRFRGRFSKANFESKRRRRLRINSGRPNTARGRQQGGQELQDRQFLASPQAVELRQQAAATVERQATVRMPGSLRQSALLVLESSPFGTDEQLLAEVSETPLPAGHLVGSGRLLLLPAFEDQQPDLPAGVQASKLCHHNRLALQRSK
jgi:hypothetical protein